MERGVGRSILHHEHDDVDPDGSGKVNHSIRARNLSKVVEKDPISTCFYRRPRRVRRRGTDAQILHEFGRIILIGKRYATPKGASRSGSVIIN